MITILKRTVIFSWINGQNLAKTCLESKWNHSKSNKIRADMLSMERITTTIRCKLDVWLWICISNDTVHRDAPILWEDKLLTLTRLPRTDNHILDGVPFRLWWFTVRNSVRRPQWAGPKLDLSTRFQNWAMQRTNYHLNENYCRSIPEHYKQGRYGGMSAIGCFAMNNEEELEWEECLIPSCDQYCSPYPNCDITECANDDDASGMYYRIGKKLVNVDIGSVFWWVSSKLKVWRLYLWKEASTQLPNWVKIAFHGQKSETLNRTLICGVVRQLPWCQDISEYLNLRFSCDKDFEKSPHSVITCQMYMALKIIFAVILIHIVWKREFPIWLLGAGSMMVANCEQKIVKYQSVQNTVLLSKEFNLKSLEFSSVK